MYLHCLLSNKCILQATERIFLEMFCRSCSKVGCIPDIFIGDTWFWENVQVAVFSTRKHPVKDGNYADMILIPVNQHAVANEICAGIFQKLFYPLL